MHVVNSTCTVFKHQCGHSAFLNAAFSIEVLISRYIRPSDICLVVIMVIAIALSWVGGDRGRYTFTHDGSILSVSRAAVVSSIKGADIL